jgi:capsular exopolysaccharide synthesis family protein
MAHDSVLEQAAEVDPGPGGAGIALWEILWRRKAYIALGVAVGLVLGILYYSMSPRTYESTAQVLVLKKRPDQPISAAAAPNATAAAANVNEDFLDTHQSVIRSAVVINNAIAKGGLEDLSVFRGSTRPAKDLAKALTVRRERDKSAGQYSNTHILNISFQGKAADDCAVVLNAVIDSYRDFLNQSTQGSTKEALELITKARDLVQNDLEKKEKEYSEFRSRTPVLWKTGVNGTTLSQERLASLDAQRAALLVRVAQIRATLEAADAAARQGRSRAELLEIVSSLPPRSSVLRGMVGQRVGTEVVSEDNPGGTTQNSLEQELVQLQLQEGKLLQDFGPAHPQVLALRDRMQTVRSLLAPSTTPEAASPEQRTADNRAKESLVNVKIGQLKQELDEVKRSAAALDTLFKSELAEAKKAFPYETQDDAFRRSIDRSQLLYDNVIKRLEELDLISSFGGYDAQVITPPTEAEKVSPRGSLVLPMALLLGFVLGGGLAYLVEATDKSFRSPEEIRRRLGLPIMGLIPVIKTNATGVRHAASGEAVVDPSICVYHRPKSKDAEAYRAVRTALYFSTRGEGSKVIQITSPNAGDGKSTLAANLAVAIAQSGKRALLVDADLRRPRMGKMFRVPEEAGFSSVLAGLAEPARAIHETLIPGLSVLPAGPLPPNPAELLTSPRLPELLGWMGEHYDYVVVDTPPLLAVTDPGAVGARADGVILAVRPTKHARVDAERAKEVLSTLGVNIFGVVVNAADLSQHRYGYGSYGYYAEADSGYYHEENGKADGPALPAGPVGEA